MIDVCYLNNEIININEIDYYLENGYYLNFCGVINNHWIYELILEDM